MKSKNLIYCLEKKRLPRRLDFALATPTVSLSYLALMNSHFAYWTNLDLVSFILNMLYKKKEEVEEGKEEKEETKTEHEKEIDQAKS